MPTTKPRILVVDDAPANLAVMGSILGQDYSVSFARNGAEALRLAAADPRPSLILLDIMMTGMDGYQVCEALKAKPETEQIPILFVTSKNEIDSEERGLALGAVDYIVKPVIPSIVLARVRTHLALHNQALLLQDVIRKRTEKLEKAQQEAEAANTAKSLFLANMSHELRTPLNGIIGMTQLLLESNPSEEQREFLEDARRSSSRLLTMVNDLLALSQVESGKVSLEACVCDVRQSLAPLLAHYAEQAEAKGLRFLTTIGDDVPERVVVDCGRVRQVLMNLLNNAMRYTLKGEIHLYCDTWNKSETGLELFFSVQDTGVGIAPEFREHIFKPFGIGEELITKRHSGAGLGLSIAKRLVELMDGDIWLETRRTDRTVFNVVIPCPAASDADCPTPENEG